LSDNTSTGCSFGDSKNALQNAYMSRENVYTITNVQKNILSNFYQMAAPPRGIIFETFAKETARTSIVALALNGVFWWTSILVHGGQGTIMFHKAGG